MPNIAVMDYQWMLEVFNSIFKLCNNHSDQNNWIMGHHSSWLLEAHD